MATQSPFQFLESILGSFKPGALPGSLPGPLPGFRPPDWVVHEASHRIVLLLNHILMQEKEATSRLARQKGRVVLMKWRFFALKLVATPAGLLDLADAAATPDLNVVVTENSPFALAQAVLQGAKPAVRIEGDVQLAAEVNWLVDHVRWDLEDDLSRIMGDVPAHAVGDAARRIGDALRQFAGSRAGATATGGSTS